MSATFNAALASEVLAYIREHPEQHHQASYVEPAEDGALDDLSPSDGEPDVLVVAENVRPTEGEYRCMTTACIAGWAVALAGPKAVTAAWNTLTDHEQDVEPWFETGRRLLGMTRPEANAVFMEFDEEAALERLAAMVEAGKGDSTKR